MNARQDAAELAGQASDKHRGRKPRALSHKSIFTKGYGDLNGRTAGDDDAEVGESGMLVDAMRDDEVYLRNIPVTRRAGIDVIVL